MTLDKILDRIKKIIANEKNDDAKILIEIYDQLSEDIILKKAVILITCVL